MASRYFNGELQVATDKECKACWSCGDPGQNFRCGFCGYKLKEGDKFRLVYTNDLKGSGGNPIVCEKCNDSNEKLRERWVDKNEKWRKLVENEFWWFYVAETDY